MLTLNRFRWSVRSLLLLVAVFASAVALWLAPAEHAVLRQTGRELDLAMVGPGYFQLTHPSGTIVYTRHGRFAVDDADSFLRYAEATDVALQLEPAISLPNDYRQLRIDPTGLVLAQSGGHEVAFGRLQLALFDQPQLLKRMSGNVFQATPESGNPQVREPGDDGAGMVQQGWLEGPPTLIDTWRTTGPLLMLVVSGGLFVVSWAPPFWVSQG